MVLLFNQSKMNFYENTSFSDRCSIPAFSYLC